MVVGYTESTNQEVRVRIVLLSDSAVNDESFESRLVFNKGLVHEVFAGPGSL